MKVKAAFIILHYKALEDTLKCVSSILKMHDTEKLRIVVIDNASDDGSGEKLKNEYAGNPLIEVILNDKNEGFSHANNQGCDLAREKWDPDFYVVANNDIAFPDTDSVKTIEELYERYRFAILGPDILNTGANVHQSPIANDPPTIGRARITVILNRICYGLFFITCPFLKWYYRNLRQNPQDKAGWDTEHENAYVAGPCVIFSRDYAKARDRFFDPETFFYAEEAIFTTWCRRHGLNIVYSPRLQVLHNESASTHLEKDAKQRIRFQMRNIIDATSIYIRYLKQNG